MKSRRFLLINFSGWYLCFLHLIEIPKQKSPKATKKATVLHLVKPMLDKIRRNWGILSYVGPKCQPAFAPESLPAGPVTAGDLWHACFFGCVFSSIIAAVWYWCGWAFANSFNLAHLKATTISGEKNQNQAEERFWQCNSEFGQLFHLMFLLWIIRPAKYKPNTRSVHVAPALSEHALSKFPVSLKKSWNMFSCVKPHA